VPHREQPLRLRKPGLKVLYGLTALVDSLFLNLVCLFLSNKKNKKKKNISCPKACTFEAHLLAAAVFSFQKCVSFVKIYLE